MVSNYLKLNKKKEEKYNNIKRVSLSRLDI